MHRLIIVSPHFPPTNAPDHQRVRLSLPYLREADWDPLVIAVEPDQVAAPQDPFLTAALPPDIPVRRVKAMGLALSRVPGLGTLGYRCRGAIRRALSESIVGSGQGTTVYFSSTQFPVHALIPELRRRHPRLCIAMDYQDPWVNPYYREHPEITPPGGRLKFRLVQSIARRTEPRVLANVDGITTVSPAYRTQLLERYPWFESTPWLELPFGGAAADFDALAQHGPSQSHFDPNDGLIHWVYVGRGGRDLALSARGLFRAVGEARKTSETMRRVRLHFLGTDYAPPARARCTLKPLADAEGVGEWVHEHPQRLPYGEALRCLTDAHAIVVPGSTDPAYSASKLYPCILAKKPLLALFHTHSPAHNVLRHCKCGFAIGFDQETPVSAIAASVRDRWIDSGGYATTPLTDWEAFADYTDRNMARRLSRFLSDSCARN